MQKKTKYNLFMANKINNSKNNMEFQEMVNLFKHNSMKIKSKE